MYMYMYPLRKLIRIFCNSVSVWDNVQMNTVHVHVHVSLRNC